MRSLLLLLLLLLPVIPAKAEEPEIQCPGLTTYEMRFLLLSQLL